MTFVRTPSVAAGRQRRLQDSVELIANLIYLAGRAETHSTQQRNYLDRAADAIVQMQHHPKLRD